LHRLGQLVRPNIQDGFVLAGERRARKILRSGGGAHREPLALPVGQLLGGPLQAGMRLVPVGGGGRGHHHPGRYWEARRGQAGKAGCLGSKQRLRRCGVQVGGVGEADHGREHLTLDPVGLGLRLVGHHGYSLVVGLRCWRW
jgi:hypothetical protein